VKQILIDQVIDTDYGQLDLVWTEDGGFDGDFDRFFAGQVNGLVGASDAAGVSQPRPQVRGLVGPHRPVG
jgi:hypothetical protein